MAKETSGRPYLRKKITKVYNIAHNFHVQRDVTVWVNGIEAMCNARLRALASQVSVAKPFLALTMSWKKNKNYKIDLKFKTCNNKNYNHFV